MAANITCLVTKSLKSAATADHIASPQTASPTVIDRPLFRCLQRHCMAVLLEVDMGENQQN